MTPCHENYLQRGTSLCNENYFYNDGRYILSIITHHYKQKVGMV